MTTNNQNNYTQLCVWPATFLDKDTPQYFEQFMLDELGVRVKYHTEVKTLPDLDENGNPISDTGNRIDLFFYIHNEDIFKFAIPRLSWGIRWWEDVISPINSNKHLYTEEFLKNHPPTW